MKNEKYALKAAGNAGAKLIEREKENLRDKEIAHNAWDSAAHAYRVYPDNKHTFVDYWTNIGKDFSAALSIKQPVNNDNA